MRLTIAAALTATALPAQAQTINAPTREEIERVPAAPSDRLPSRLRVEGGVEHAPCPLADARFASVTVPLTQVVFDNLRGLTEADLRPAFAQYLGRTVPIATICEIRDAAATILRRAGYLAAVQVPPQRIEGGVVRFDVLMARLVSVQVRGDAGRSERQIAAYLEKLTAEPVFNERTAERYLLLARDLPGLDVRLRLRPTGATPGDVVGEVMVQKQDYAVDASIQNLGSHEAGRWGALLRAEIYDLLGGDRVTFGGYATADISEQQVVMLGYEKRIGADGLTVGGRFTHAWTDPDLGAAAGGDIKSRTLLAAIEAGYPLRRSQAMNLRVAGGMEVINQKLRFNGIPISRDRLRILYGRLDFDMIDRASIASIKGYSGAEPRWRLAGSLELRKGIALFNASDEGATTPQLSRIEADPQAALIRFDGTAEYRPAPKLTFSLSPRWQYTSRPLASYEEFSSGSFTVGRGYDPGTIIGDKGLGFQSEIRIGRIVPASRESVTFQPYAFWDHAWVWNNQSPDIRLQSRQSLSSAGGGVRMAWGDRARLDLSLAAPLKDAGIANQKGDPRILVSLSTRLLPW